jgi:hypothetical protein
MLRAIQTLPSDTVDSLTDPYSLDPPYLSEEEQTLAKKQWMEHLRSTTDRLNSSFSLMREVPLPDQSVSFAIGLMNATLL